MEKNPLSGLGEIIFSSADKKESRQVSQLEKRGIIRKIAPRVYTSNFSEDDETIIRRNLFVILGKLYPGALLSHRSALEFKPTEAGHIFLTYGYTKKVSLPGVVLRFMEGPGPVAGDNPYFGELYVSQLERALLENMQVSRQSGPESKIWDTARIEDRLEQEVRVRGENGLNRIRDKARLLSEELGMPAEFEKLNRLIGALLSTKPSKTLSSPLALARAYGNPYDPARIPLFEALFVDLRGRAFPEFPETNVTEPAFRNFAFFESYFSNYIEGTVFELSEAKEIIETQRPITARNEDSHDVLGTYRIVANRGEMAVLPDNPARFMEILLYRHSVLLSARLVKAPGSFKDRNNRAGETHFVDHTLVRGTLTKGFDFYEALENPFARAVFMMFLVSEVHPFLDGNGRMARVMMNAELVAAGQSKIIIPTVFREDYMGALRKLTRQGDTDTYIRMLLKAAEFSHTVAGENRDTMERHLQLCNAFSEPNEAKLRIVKE